MLPLESSGTNNGSAVWAKQCTNPVALDVHRGERWRGAVSGLFAMALAGTVYAEQVVCTVTYGGETQQLVAPPVSSPYSVNSIEVGSYFHLRVVFQKWPADLASIKIYTYADRDEGLVPVHQATYPYPLASSGAARHGLTGLHWVYEPTRDGELEYWCRLSGRSTQSAGARR